MLTDVSRDYDGLMAWLLDHPQYEGLVWHHPDGRMVKLEYRDALAGKWFTESWSQFVAQVPFSQRDVQSRDRAARNGHRVQYPHP